MHPALARLNQVLRDKGETEEDAKLAVLTVEHAARAISEEMQMDQATLAHALDALSTWDISRRILDAVPSIADAKARPHAENAAAESGRPGIEHCRSDAASSVTNAAWRIAYRLGSTRTGLRVLHCLCRPASGSSTQSPEHHRWLLAYMTACNALAKERNSLQTGISSWAPQELEQAIGTHAATQELPLLEQAILALRQQFLHTHAPDAPRIDAPGAWAITAVENGFTSMESLQAPAARLEKLATKWVERALSGSPSRRGLAHALQESRMLFRRYNPQRKKSPFLGLYLSGSGAPGSFGVADSSGLSSQRAIAAALEEMKQALAETPAPMSRRRNIDGGAQFVQAAVSQDLRPDESLAREVRRAIVKYWSAPERMSLLGAAGRIPMHELERLEEKVLSRMAMPSRVSPDVRTNISVRSDIQRLLQAENRTMDASTLRMLADGIPGCDRKRIDHLLNAATSAPSPHKLAPELSRKDLSKGLCCALQHMDLGSRINLSSGGLLGIGSKGASGTLSGLFGSGLLRYRLDARYVRSRQAMCEIGASHYGAEMLVGTQTQVRQQLGAGAFAGVQIGPASLGGGLDIAVARDTTSTSSVLLRLARPENGAHEIKQSLESMQDVVRFILEKPASGGRITGKPDKDLLIRLFEQFPDLSIGQKAPSAEPNRSTAAKAALSVGAFFRKGLFRSGLGASCMAEHRRFHRYHYQESSGRLRVERTTFGQMKRLNISAGIHAAGLALPVLGSNARADGGTTGEGGGADSIQWTQNTPGADFLQWNADAYRNGLATRITLVSEHGEVKQHSSCTRVHINAHHYVETIRSDLSAWADCMAKRWNSASYAAGGVAREMARTDARHRITGFLDCVARNADPAQTFHEHFELQPHAVRRLNALRELERQAGDAPAAGAYRKMIQATLENESYWEPVHLLVYDASIEQRGKRIDLLLKAASSHDKGTTRIVQML